MRVLVTGLGTLWGSRVAQELEQEKKAKVIVGVDSREPVLPLERTEFVRADSSYEILHRIVHATQVDTVLHTHLVVDSTTLSGRALQDLNVIGTMNLLAAAGAADSPVRKLVVKSSTLVYGASREDPYFFGEEARRSHTAQTRVERSLLEVESYLHDFAMDNPHVDVTLLRFTNVLGSSIETPISRALRLPIVPEVLGYDPRFQFTHEDDVVGALMHATSRAVPGIHNVAGDGTLPWSEVCAIVGKRRLPMPPLFTGLATEPLRFLRLVDLPPELLALLRYGRGVDNRRYKATGFEYRYTSAGAVEA
ncbi:MAG: NAD-dependent epimerase/dehydratase family protein, partial [Acidimicrobiia bacterium]